MALTSEDPAIRRSTIVQNRSIFFCCCCYTVAKFVAGRWDLFLLETTLLLTRYLAIDVTVQSSEDISVCVHSQKGTDKSRTSTVLL